MDKMTTVRGDEGALPDRGTSTGVTNDYGADLGGDAKNRIKGISGQTDSDPAMDDMPPGPNL